MFSSTTILLVNSSPKTNVSGSLKPLSLCRAFLLSHAEQVTQTFQVFVNLLPVDLQLLASFRRAASTAFLDRDFDNRFFARIFIFWEFVFVLKIIIKSGVELSLPKITRSQDETRICV